MVSFALDWRFARHVDLNAGVSRQPKFGVFVNGSGLSTNNGTLTGWLVAAQPIAARPGSQLGSGHRPARPVLIKISE